MSYKFCVACNDKTSCAANKACAIGSADADFSVDASLQNTNPEAEAEEKDPPFKDVCLNCGFEIKKIADYLKHHKQTGHGLFSKITGEFTPPK